MTDVFTAFDTVSGDATTGKVGRQVKGYKKPYFAHWNLEYALRKTFGNGPAAFSVPVRITVQRGRIVIEAEDALHGV